MSDEAWAAVPGVAPELVGYAQADVRFGVGEPPAELVSRLHLVALTAQGEVLVCRSVEDWRFLPGGTREPGETVSELARRELREEAGAEIVGDLRVVAAHEARSRLPEPYRAHLPHPRAFWAYGVCRAVVTGPPTNPDDGETVVEVTALPPWAAVAELERTSDASPIHARVLRDLLELSLIGSSGT